MRFEFTLITDARHLDDLPLDALYEAGCGDGYPASGNGVAYIPFGREAADYPTALATAARDVTTAFKAAGVPFRVVAVATADYDPFRPGDAAGAPPRSEVA